MKNKEIIKIINRCFHVNGESVKAIDMLENMSKEVLIKTLAYIIGRAEQSE